MRNYQCSCGETWESEQGRIDCEKSHVRAGSRKVRNERDKLRREYVEWFDSPTREYGWITPSSDWLKRVRSLLSESER